jgi:hypothetical protein
MESNGWADGLTVAISVPLEGPEAESDMAAVVGEMILSVVSRHRGTIAAAIDHPNAISLKQCGRSGRSQDRRW